MVSATAQGSALILSSFHANVILGLSWMNNTNTFIYFLLYLQHRSQLGPRQIRSDLSSWWKKVLGWVYCSDAVAHSGLDDRTAQRKNSSDDPGEFEQRSLLSAIFKVDISGAGAIALLGSLHLSMMSALGLWLWSNPSSFGNAKCADLCAMEFSSYVILGQSIPLRSRALRVVSLVIYAALAVPGLNLLLPMSVFPCMVFVYRAYRRIRHTSNVDPPSKGGVHAQKPTAKMGLAQVYSFFVLQGRANPFLFPVFAGIVIQFAIDVISIIDIERTFQTNGQLVTEGESEWTFGQILAMVMLVLPIRDLRIFAARRNFTASLRNALGWPASTDILRDLVRRGAHVNAEVEGITTLILAVQRRDADFTRMLLVYGARPNVKDRKDCTPLYTASLNGDLQIVRLLLSNSADPNIEGGEYSTPLQAASQSGNLEIVQLLLESGADINMRGGKCGTALEATSAAGHTEIAELLRAHGATS
ncbi:ankyrin repeat-containing domain protein [Mycena galopus ATCC 62051]|nr:ankyrin repeat-containing domain protein [Mycena galopus ATCC 62051]